MARNPDNWVGLKLAAGRFRVERKLGEGGMGFVYKARDTKLGRSVVIKVPRAAMLVERQFIERFVRELRSLVKLDHPHIVAIQDYGQEDKIPFAVMQFLGGGELTARISRDPAQLDAWLPAIARALDYVHARGYVHRDVKPGNILFDEEGHAFLSDFGIAKVVSDTQQEQDNLTGTGMAIGTSDYMAPELIMGKEISGSIDQYALAITVYESLAGKRPFTGNSPSAIMVAHTTEQPAAIDGLPAGTQQALLRGMAKNPADRYANCTAFAEAISASLVGASVAASSYSLAPPSPPPSPPASDSVRLNCPECGKSLRATAQAAGRSVTCPGCGVKLRVAEDLSGLAVRDPAAGSPGSSKETMILDPASGTSKPGRRPAGPGSGSGSPLPMDTDATRATIDTSDWELEAAYIKAIGTLLRRTWDHIPKSMNALVVVVVGLAVVLLVGLLGLALFSTDEQPEAGTATSAESEGTDLKPQRALQAQLEAERAARAAAEKKAAAQIARLEREKSDAKKAAAEGERARLEREQAARRKAVREAARAKAAQEAARRKRGRTAQKQARPNFTAHTISTDAKGARSVFAADVDSDGDIDVLSASEYDNKIAWYENDGRQNFTPHTISTGVKSAQSVFAADVDGDGDIDVLSASGSDRRYGQSGGNSIAWHENDGRQNFTTRTISTKSKGARSVFAADVDSDGDIDVLSVSQFDNKIAWYENDGRQNFISRTITMGPKGARSVFAADVDGDGDTDVLRASSNDDKIAWYENDGRQNFTAHTITKDADGATSVFAADVDGDGDTDVLSAAHPYDNKIAWYENDGRQNFISHTISNDAYSRSVFATDVDGDGDTDVLSASSTSRNNIAWYENDGRENFTPRTISTDAKGARSVFAADVDSDGDIDVLSASEYDNKIAWYENDLIEAAADTGLARGSGGMGGLHQARFTSTQRADLDRRRLQMVKPLSEDQKFDPAVLNAMSVVPMELFCPTSQLSNVYKNQPIPIGYDETISQPFMTAVMLSVLQVDRGDKVLELKTASGYQTALLAQMGAEVTSLESDRALARVMAPTLNSLGFDNLHYIVGGDCYAGLPKNGPYDRIIATAAYAAPPPIALFNQLKPGGRLIAPVGKAVGDQYLMAYTKTSSGEVKADKLMQVSFGPMPR